MTVRELMNEALNGRYESLILLIDLLVTDKKTVSYEDDISVLDFYLQDKFRDKINGHIKGLKLKKGAN